jgi:hypothetical protein
VHKRIIAAVMRVEFVSDRMSYIILRCCWHHVIVLNVHAPTEDKIDDVKDSFCEELEHIFDKFCKCHMKILSVIGREDNFKITVGNESYMKLVMMKELT